MTHRGEYPYVIDEIFGSFDRGGETIHYVNNEDAMAILLLNSVCFLNSRKFVYDCFGKKEPEIQEPTVFVSCSDTFAYACADAECITLKEVGPLFRQWHDHGWQGVTRWACLRRNRRPIAPIIEKLKTAGVWNDEMEAIST